MSFYDESIFFQTDTLVYSLSIVIPFHYQAYLINKNIHPKIVVCVK